jgi:prevent-host-death family protein
VHAFDHRSTSGGSSWFEEEQDDHYDDYMTKSISATEAKAKLLAILDDIERGDEIEITRRGVPIARLSPIRRPKLKMGRLAGMARTTDPSDDLLSTGLDWNLP